MVQMRVLCLLVAFAVGSLIEVSPCFAWEFEMKGSFIYSYEWYSQLGRSGFFGPYNVDRGTNTAVANLNFWSGYRYDRHASSGSDTGWAYYKVEFWPKIKINKAIRFSGKYRLGLYGEPDAWDYIALNAPGTNRAFSEGQWNLFWVSAVTPWGTFAVGKRPWVFGPGLQYDGEDAATTESVSLVAPCGPFDFGFAFYPYRYVGDSIIAKYAYEDPFDLPVYTTAGGQSIRGQYFCRGDRSGAFSGDFVAFVVYHRGPVTLGVLGSFGNYHVGPEAILVDPADPLAQTPVPLDSELSHGTAFIKYLDGRFFLNAEAAWLYWTDRFHAGVLQPFIGPPNPRYIEQWRYMVELGFMVGPAKLSLLQARCPGPDRRNGTMIDRQPAAFVRHPTFERYLANTDVFQNYSCLFSFNYGSGLNSYSLSWNGFVRDALVFAARLDYAIAANLNLYGSVFYANRTSNGYSWACIGPNLGAGNFPNRRDGDLDFNFNRIPASPNIPDTSLGYEFDVGMDWKVLEGWRVSTVVGFWQPGRWFNYACIDRSVPDWQNGVAGNLFGTRPDRRIDPVTGGQFTLTFEF